METSNLFFDRIEQKYLIDNNRKVQLIKSLREFTTGDKHGIDGCYTVSTLYHDTDDWLLYNQKLSEEKWRQKIRIRGYNRLFSNSKVFVEIKRKTQGKLEKMRIKLPLYKAYSSVITQNVLKYGPEKVSDEEKRAYNEVQNVLNMYALSPKLLINYDRMALMGIKEQGLRITLDSNIQCRSHDLRLESPRTGSNLIVPEYSILEVKSQGSLPEWLTYTLDELELVPERISKCALGIESIRTALM